MDATPVRESAPQSLICCPGNTTQETAAGPPRSRDAELAYGLDRGRGLMIGLLLGLVLIVGVVGLVLWAL